MKFAKGHKSRIARIHMYDTKLQLIAFNFAQDKRLISLLVSALHCHLIRCIICPRRATDAQYYHS